MDSRPPASTSPCFRRLPTILPDGTIVPGTTHLASRSGPNSVVWNGATLGISWRIGAANWFETSECLDDASAPPCPSSTGSFGAGGITVSWPAVTDPESGVSRYFVYRDDLLLAENFATTLSILDGGYVPGTTHAYEVRAANTALLESSNCSTILVFAGFFPCGDVNADGAVTLLDVFYLVNFLFANGTTPVEGDVNNDGSTNAADIVYLINSLLAAGPAPDCG